MNKSPYWEELLNTTSVIDNRKATGEQKWDPLIDGPVNAVHLYEPGKFYVTLREGEENKFHHMGWECKDKQSVLYAGKILQEIGWPIVWQGDIDKSYVLHFQGPDARVHDFFTTSQELKHKED